MVYNELSRDREADSRGAILSTSKASGEGTKMVHGRARAPSRQTLRVAANEVRSRVAPPKGADLFLLSQTGISKRDVITYS
jgi:hypothetical protein